MSFYCTFMLRCGRVLSKDFRGKFPAVVFKENKYSTVASLEETDYPPIKPRFPPAAGGWGDISEKLAWRWHDRGEELKALPTAKDKADSLCESKVPAWDFPAVQAEPQTFDYQLNATKTHLRTGTLPDMYQDISVEKERLALKSLVIDVLEMEFDRINREKLRRKIKKSDQDDRCKQLLLKNLLQTIVTTLCGMGHEHLLRSVLDENVTVSAFWDRHGVQPIRQKGGWVSSCFELQTSSRLQSTNRPDFQLRVEKPLPEFLSRYDPLCSSVPCPINSYHPKDLCQFKSREDHSVDPGYVFGDPCEFNLLTVLNTDCAPVRRVQGLHGEAGAGVTRLGYAINSSFLSTYSQAHSQGFNSYNELTYPLTTQTIMSDGQTFSLLCYQLNTVHLWKNDEGNPLTNLCWASNESKLFDSIENGKISGFNDELFDMLLKFFVIKPAVPEGVDLRPYISKDVPSPLDHTKYIDTIEEMIMQEEEEVVYDD